VSALASIERRAAGLAATVVGLAALSLAGPAQAQVAAVTPGHDVGIFANLDLVTTTGWQAGDVVTAVVTRDGREIGRAGGPAGTTPGGTGLEINHGPAGTPRPGDCWDVHTPDILPGDVVTITAEREGVPLPATDTVTVDDILITGDPFLVGEDVVVEGIATFAGGPPIPANLASLNAGESRNIAPIVRATPSRIERISGTTDGWRATYAAGDDYGVSTGKGDDESKATKRDAVLNANIGHAMGYTTAGVTQVADGVGDSSGPGPGCDGSPSERDALTGASLDAVNSAGIEAGEDLVVTGVVASTDSVKVSVPGGADHNGDVTGATWSATIPAAELAVQPDGRVVVTAAFQGPFAPPAGARVSELALTKDTVAPAAPTANPASGTYATAQSVTLTSAGETATVHYTNDGSTPTAFNNVALGPVPVTASQTLRAVAVDGVGNPSAVATFAYVIAPPPAAGGNPGPTPPGGQTAGPGAGTPTAPVVVQTSAAPSLSGAATGGPKAATLTLARLSATPRLKRQTARTRGLRLVMRLNSGTHVVRIRIYRTLGAGKRVLLTSGLRSPSASLPYRVQLRDPKLRNALTVGSYEAEVTPGASRADLGKSSKVAFRVVR
jgi:hypothetical protein